MAVTPFVDGDFPGDHSWLDKCLLCTSAAGEAILNTNGLGGLKSIFFFSVSRLFFLMGISPVTQYEQQPSLVSVRSKIAHSSQFELSIIWVLNVHDLLDLPQHGTGWCNELPTLAGWRLWKYASFWKSQQTVCSPVMEKQSFNFTFRKVTYSCTFGPWWRK